MIFTQDEMEVLSILRTENVESVEILMDPKSKNIEFINYTDTIKIDAFQRLNELIMRNGYQEITITTQKGRIARCENKIKIKK